MPDEPASTPSTALDDVALALQLAVHGDRDGAAEAAAHAAEHGALLGHALHDFLVDEGSGGDVYAFPDAFRAFIRGGGNVGLYQATSAFLAAGFHGAGSLLDIGCGDGLALVPALRSAGSGAPADVRLLEPSTDLLERAIADTTAATGRAPAADTRRLQDFVHDEGWGTVDLVQSTFALHTLPPEERSAALAVLAGRTRRLQLVEFDVELPEPGTPEHTRELVARYERGLAEYTDTRDLVARGFLVPVLLGQLAPGAVRATWEQPAAAWADQLRQAGFTDVEITGVAPYWWSPAFGLRATGKAGVPA